MRTHRSGAGLRLPSWNDQAARPRLPALHVVRLGYVQGDGAAGPRAGPTAGAGASAAKGGADDVIGAEFEVKK